MKISLFLTILGSSFALACGPSSSDDPTSGSSGSSGSTGDSATVTATVSASASDTMTTMGSMSASDTTPTTTDTTPTTTDTTPTTTDADTTAGTDATTTDATSGSSGSGDSGSSTDPGTSTGGDAVDYGPCDFTDPENPTCPEGQICQTIDFGEFAGTHWCGVPCMDIADDCPASPNDTAVVECSGLGLCALDCGDGDCPDGMECHPIGSGDRCVWPAPV